MRISPSFSGEERALFWRKKHDKMGDLVRQFGVKWEFIAQKRCWLSALARGHQGLENWPGPSSWYFRHVDTLAQPAPLTSKRKSMTTAGRWPSVRVRWSGRPAVKFKVRVRLCKTCGCALPTASCCEVCSR